MFPPSLVLKIGIVTAFIQAVFNKETTTESNPMLELNLSGTYRWDLILDIDNLANNQAVERNVSISTSTYFSYGSMKDSLNSGSVGASLSAELSGTYYGVVTASVKSQVSTEIKASYQNIIEDCSESKEETRKTDVYKVGPKSTLKLYRLVYNGPGVQFETDTISSVPHPIESVQISATVKQLWFLKAIDVVYTKDFLSAPENIMWMPNDPFGDINKGIDGDFAWLVPVWTTKINEAATGLEIIIQDTENKDYENIARGDGGRYRYIKVLKRYANNNQRISHMALWRSETEWTPVMYWQYKSIDINTGRGGDWLHLVWNTTSI